jgi:hypothetical protein
VRPETKLYRQMRDILKPYVINLCRVENSVDVGTPDVYFYTPVSEGWIELKQIPEYPKKMDTEIQIPWRPGQLSWIKRRMSMNENTNVYLYVVVQGDLHLFRNKNIQYTYTRRELLSKAIVLGRVNDKEFVKKLYRKLLL